MTKVITVTRMNGDVHETIVDADFNYDGKVYWQQGYFYIWDKERRKNIRLHRYIMDVTDPNIIVDHIDINPNNNTRDNLRVCSLKQNNQNKKSKGYFLDRKSGKWRACVKSNGKRIYLGLHDTEEKAHKAYKEGHARIFREFSPYYKEAN
ncbi:AP2/ERF family transcription factor [Bacillus toyonensis]|uniref:AP2 domain-containing protein n=1 Tax=Bacillus toyonensis TaxID=155322 RepID=UPI000BEFD984|nr:AP2 domain-containing protein [Bacillus toyonensis]KAB2380216.1 hypothetical protein F8507_27425 [Bacillus toyonensis]PEM64448.1 hypothetical protein CN625_01675 [Bacillus toyonensis]